MAKFKDGIVKGAKLIGAGFTAAVVGTIGSIGGLETFETGKSVYKAVNRKINPIVWERKHWWKKAEPKNARTGKWLSDKKTKKR